MKIRVCLSGSGFRFPAHVGALAAIEEQFEIVELSGTSGGSIVSTMFAAGYSVERLKHLTFNNDFSKFIEFTPLSLLNFSWCNGKRLRSFLIEHIGEYTTFNQLRIPVTVVASDLRKSEMVTFKGDDNVVTAVRASTAVPFIYEPIRSNNFWIVDGGITSNIPVEQLTDDDTLKIGVKLVSDIDQTPVDSSLDVLGRAANLLFESNDKAHVDYSRMNGALFAFPNTGSIGSFDTKASKSVRESMFNVGYYETKRVLDSYKKAKSSSRSTDHNYRAINSSLYFKD